MANRARFTVTSVVKNVDPQRSSQATPPPNYNSNTPPDYQGNRGYPVTYTVTLTAVDGPDNNDFFVSPRDNTITMSFVGHAAASQFVQGTQMCVDFSPVPVAGVSNADYDKGYASGLSAAGLSADLVTQLKASQAAQAAPAAQTYPNDVDGTEQARREAAARAGQPYGQSDADRAAWDRANQNQSNQGNPGNPYPGDTAAQAEARRVEDARIAASRR